MSKLKVVPSADKSYRAQLPQLGLRQECEDVLTYDVSPELQELLEEAVHLNTTAGKLDSNFLGQQIDEFLAVARKLRERLAPNLEAELHYLINEIHNEISKHRQAIDCHEAKIAELKALAAPATVFCAHDIDDECPFCE